MVGVVDRRPRPSSSPSRRHKSEEGPMLVRSRFRRTADRGDIEGDDRWTACLGGALAAIGIAVLLIALTSFKPD